MKKAIALLLLSTILLTGIVIALFSGFYATTSLQNSIEESLNVFHKNLKHRFAAFDSALALEERRINEKIRIDLPKMTEELNRFEIEAQNLPVSTLTSIKNKYGVSEFYLIDKKGEIISTTFFPDLGFNLNNISEEFSAHLQKMYGSGKVFFDRLSLSSKTGKLNIYSYYSPKGSDYIYEISIDMRKYIARLRGQAYSEYLFKHFFADAVRGDVSISDIDLFMINDIAGWSVANPGKKLDAQIHKQLTGKKELRISTGNKLTIYSDFNAPNWFGFFNQPFKTMIEMDISRLRNIPKEIALATLISLLIILPIAFFIASRAMHSVIFKPTQNLINGLEEIAKGNYESPLADSKLEEFNRIISVANKMRRRIIRREMQLKTHQEELENRVAERTVELQKAIETAEKLSHTDMLTQINNRRAFYAQGNQLLELAIRNNTPLSIIMIDIDHFKKINDSYGHSAGDLALVKLAQSLKSLARSSDIIGRIGGEEFAFILHNTSAQNAFVFAERLRVLISGLKIETESVHLSMTASFGIAENDKNSIKLEKIIDNADKALYQAKNAGRNCTRVFFASPKDAPTNVVPIKNQHNPE